MSDDMFDFGFTAVDDLPTGEVQPQQPVVAKVDDAQLNTILDKIERIESLIIQSDSSGMINEHRECDGITIDFPVDFKSRNGPQHGYPEIVVGRPGAGSGRCL